MKKSYTKEVISCNVKEGRFDLVIEDASFRIIDISESAKRGFIIYDKLYGIDFTESSFRLWDFTKDFAYGTSRQTTLEDLINYCERNLAIY